MPKLENLVVNKIALVRKTHQPVNPEAVIEVVKAQPLRVAKEELVTLFGETLRSLMEAKPSTPVLKAKDEEDKEESTKEDVAAELQRERKKEDKDTKKSESIAELYADFQERVLLPVHKAFIEAMSVEKASAGAAMASEVRGSVETMSREATQFVQALRATVDGTGRATNEGDGIITKAGVNPTGGEPRAAGMVADTVLAARGTDVTDGIRQQGGTGIPLDLNAPGITRAGERAAANLTDLVHPVDGITSGMAKSSAPPGPDNATPGIREGGEFADNNIANGAYDIPTDRMAGEVIVGNAVQIGLTPVLKALEAQTALLTALQSRMDKFEATSASVVEKAAQAAKEWDQEVQAARRDPTPPLLLGRERIVHKAPPITQDMSFSEAVRSLSQTR